MGNAQEKQKNGKLKDPGLMGALLKSTSDQVFVFDHQLQITDCSPALAHVIGLKSSEILGKPVNAFLTTTVPDAFETVLFEVLSHNQSKEVEQLKLVIDQKTVLWCTATFYPLTDKKGTSSGGFALLRESERYRNAQLRAMAAEQTFNFITQVSDQLICHLGPTGYICKVSGDYFGQLGYTPDELLGQPAASLLHPDDLSAIAAEGLGEPDSNSTKPFMHRLRHKEGQYIWFESHSKSIRYPDTQLLLESVIVATPMPGRTLVSTEKAEQVTRPQGTAPDFLPLALNATLTGVWAWHASSELCEWDDRMEQLFGLEPGTFDGALDTFINLIHEDDRDTVQQAMRQTIITGEPYKTDFKVIRPDNSLRYIHARGQLLYLPNGMPDQIIGLCVDITERKLAEQKVAEQQALLKSVLDSSLSAIFSLQPIRNQSGQITDFTFRLINRAGAEMLNREIEELNGLSFLKVFPESKQEGLFDYYCSVVETRMPVSFEKLFVAGGKSAWFAVQASVLEAGLTATITNINNQKESQRLLQENQYFLEKVNETGPFLIAVIDLNARKAVYSSKRLHSFLGFATPKLQSESFDDFLQLLHPDDVARLPACLQQAASAADYDVLRLLFRLRDRFSNYRWYQTYAKVFRRDDQGHVSEIVCLLHDVDQSEQNKNLLNAMLDSSMSGIMAYESVRDASGHIIDFRWVLMNKPAEQMIGRKARYILGKSMMQEMPGNLGEGIFDKFAEVVETGKPARFEHFYTYQGCLTWFEISAVKMGDGFTATFSDITGRKSAEWELLENQLFNQKITDAAPFIIAVYELNSGKPLYYNSQLTEILGYTFEEMVEHSANSFISLVHPEDAGKIRKHAEKLASAGNGEVISIELRLCNANGEYRWFFCRDMIFRRNEDDNTIEILSIINCVDELRQSVSRLNMLLDASVFGICALKALRNEKNEIVNFEWMLANHRTEDILGVEAGSLIGKRMLDLYPGHLTSGLFADYEHTVNTGKSIQRELVHAKDGKSSLLQVTAVKLEDGLMVMTEDVTDRKNALNAQLKTDMLLADVQKVARLGLWELNLATGDMHWSEELCHLLSAFDTSLNTNYGHFLSLMDSETRHMFDATLKDSAAKGSAFTIEHGITTVTGTEKYLITRGQMLPGEAGHTQKLVGICMDISEMHAMQERLESAELLRHLSEAVPQIIWTTDPGGNTEFINAHWYTYTGLPTHQLPVCPILDIAADHHKQAYLEAWKKSLATGDPLEIEIEVKRADGEYRWHLLRLVAQKNAQGKPLRWYGTATETHDLKSALGATQQLSERLREKNQQLKLAYTEMDNFHYAAAHDLRQPINNLAGLIEALEEEMPATGNQADYLVTMMQNAVARFKTILDEMTEIRIAESARGETAESICLASLVEEILSDIKPLLQKEQAIVKYDFKVGAIRFPRKNLRSILYNLITNAIKYRSADRAPKIFLQSTPAEGGKILLTVQDNSMGIDQESLPLVFNLFKRVHTNIDGTGMGLYIVKKMIEQNGGTIEAESKVGVGTTFSIYFPDSARV